MFRAGIDIKQVMEHSRHKSIDIALNYVQAERAMKNPGLKQLVL